MASRLSLKSFLASARTALTAPAAQRSTPLTFVVGNESADLDSLCSAVVFAYIRSSSPPHTLHIPLSNLPRSDLGLRTEMTAVLRRAGLSPSDLLTLSELPELDPSDTQWFLVDHNSLTGQLKKYAGQVVGCVDHRVDEGAVSPGATPRVIEPCGSCMSLVVDVSRDAWDALKQAPEDSDAVTEDDKLAKLALAPILIDTLNMTAEDRVREKDTRAVSYLAGKLQDKEFNNTKYHDEIASVKEDISQLSFRDIFRKDYKEWQDGDMTLGISSVVQNFDYLLEKAQAADTFLNELSKWADERSLDIASVMTTSSPNDEFQRHILVWARTAKGLPALEKFIDISDKLRLEKWKDGKLDDGKTRFAWKQGNSIASRKQVAPLLREAIQKMGIIENGEISKL